MNCKTSLSTYLPHIAINKIIRDTERFNLKNTKNISYFFIALNFIH